MYPLIQGKASCLAASFGNTEVCNISAQIQAESKPFREFLANQIKKYSQERTQLSTWIYLPENLICCKLSDILCNDTSKGHSCLCKQVKLFWPKVAMICCNMLQTTPRVKWYFDFIMTSFPVSVFGFVDLNKDLEQRSKRNPQNYIFILYVAWHKYPA